MFLRQRSARSNKESLLPYSASTKAKRSRISFVVVILGGLIILSLLGIFFARNYCSSRNICYRFPNQAPDAPKALIEENMNAGVAMLYSVFDKLEDFKSKYQHIQVFESYDLGKILVLDGDLQLTEKDESFYHEMLGHIPMAYLFEKPKLRVLILGGGDGGLAYQVLRYDNVERVTLVDIDSDVVRISKKHFPKLSRAFADSRMSVVYNSAGEWVADRVARIEAQGYSVSNDESKRDDMKFDLIMVDSTDYDTPIHYSHQSLTTPDFYKRVKSLLQKDGIFAVNADSPAWNLQTVKLVMDNLVESGFSTVCPFLGNQPTFLSGFYSFIFASNSVNPFLEKIDWGKWTALQLRMDYYSPDVHYASFVLPRYFDRINSYCPSKVLSSIQSFAGEGQTLDAPMRDMYVYNRGGIELETNLD